MADLKESFVSNWFYPVALVLFVLVWALVTTSGAIPQAGHGFSLEVALLADVFLTLPALYWLCFRNRHGKARLFLGLIAVVCSGMWLAGQIVPVAEQRILPQFSWLRYTGLAIIVAFEVRLAALALRVMWKPQASLADLEGQGVPPIVAKLMIAEARFWRWVLSAFRK